VFDLQLETLDPDAADLLGAPAAHAG